MADLGEIVYIVVGFAGNRFRFRMVFGDRAQDREIHTRMTSIAAVGAGGGAQSFRIIVAV